MIGQLQRLKTMSLLQNRPHKASKKTQTTDFRRHLDRI